MMTDVFVVYISNRTDPTDPTLVREIAIEASQTNRKLGVTGMAVGNSFLQVLEGRKEVVETLLDKIGKDSRHTDVRVLYQGALPDRLFGQWSMGCQQSNRNAVPSEAILPTIQAQIEGLCEELTQQKG